MTKLLRMNRSMIQRLNRVGAEKADPLVVEVRDGVKDFVGAPTPDTGIYFLCDRCRPNADAEPTYVEGREVWTIPLFKMVICDACAEAIRRGGDALLPEYFECAEKLLSTLLTPEERKLALANGTDWTYENIVKKKATRWQTRARRPWPLDYVMVAIADAIRALTEERTTLEEWRKLPLE